MDDPKRRETLTGFVKTRELTRGVIVEAKMGFGGVETCLTVSTFVEATADAAG